MKRGDPPPGPTPRLSLPEKLTYTVLVLLGAMLLVEVGLRVTGFIVLRARGAGSGAAGDRVVLCLGDSVTWGVKVEAEEAYPARLEALLKEQLPGAGWRVINAAVPGANSSEVLARMRRAMKQWRPGVVLILTGERDRSKFNGVSTVMSDAGAAGGDPSGAAWYSPSRLKVYRLARLLWLSSGGTDELAPRPPPSRGDSTREWDEFLAEEEGPEDADEPAALKKVGPTAEALLGRARAKLKQGRRIKALHLLQDSVDRYQKDRPLRELFHRTARLLETHYIKPPLPGPGKALTWRPHPLSRVDVSSLLALSAFLLCGGHVAAGEEVLERAEGLLRSPPAGERGAAQAVADGQRARVLRLWVEIRGLAKSPDFYLELARDVAPIHGVAGFLDESVEALAWIENWRAVTRLLPAARQVNPHRRLHHLYLEGQAHKYQGRAQAYRHAVARLQRLAPGSSRAIQLRLGWQTVLRRNLRAMVRLARQAGARPVLLGYGHASHLGEIKIMSGYARELGVPWMPTRPAFERVLASGVPLGRLFIDEGGHPTVRGHRVLAAEVARQLRGKEVLR